MWSCYVIIFAQVHQGCLWLIRFGQTRSTRLRNQSVQLGWNIPQCGGAGGTSLGTMNLSAARALSINDVKDWMFPSHCMPHFLERKSHQTAELSGAIDTITAVMTTMFKICFHTIKIQLQNNNFMHGPCLVCEYIFNVVVPIKLLNWTLY